jgi:hypothetical protein
VVPSVVVFMAAGYWLLKRSVSRPPALRGPASSV